MLYLFGFSTDKLIIGKFCQIATGVRFMMNGANHAMKGVSTYPFKVFGESWNDVELDIVSKGDIVIGHDVWIGNSATIMQGVNIGHGAIIGTNALVTKDVAPYTVVGGNPAKVIRQRFDDDTVDFLVKLAWWDWPLDTYIDGDFIRCVIDFKITQITTLIFIICRKVVPYSLPGFYDGEGHGTNTLKNQIMSCVYLNGIKFNAWIIALNARCDII